MNKESKGEMVRGMFNDIAPTYDRLNHILSFDIDKLWRKRVVRIVRKLGAKYIMDMATGTGDLAIKMAKVCISLSQMELKHILHLWKLMLGQELMLKKYI